MKILIDPGIMPPHRMMDYWRRSKYDASFITDSESKRLEYVTLDPTVSVSMYPQRDGQISVEGLRADPVKIWNKLIDDHQTLMILDRTARVPLSSSLKIALVIDRATRCQSYLERESPDVLVYMAAPHDITRWIFAKVAETLGIRVIYFQETLLPWRFAMMQGLRRDSVLIPPSIAVASKNEANLAADYARTKRGGFDEAFPGVEKNRLSKNRGKYYNFANDVLQSWRRPDLILNKALCHKAYSRLARCPSQSDTYVAFFLHFQPERTTLPEAYGFSQQLAAITALANALPEGTKICVKEHPTIFTLQCMWKERLPFWYDMIAKIKNVQLVPIETDPYELIDRSVCVVTIAGTVAGEALIRGKPVVIFGRGPMSLVQTPALHKYENQEGLREFLSLLDGLEKDQFELMDYFRQIADKTYSGATSETKFTTAQEQLDQVRFAALLAAFADILNVAQK